MKDVRDVRRRAVHGLLSLQRPDGGFAEYHLPVGTATEWVTALAGLALAEAGETGAARRASASLRVGRSYVTGFGYNGNTGPDADSTSHALLLFGVLGEAPPPDDLRWLRSLWRENGFATYPRTDGWGGAHADVTPYAYRALAPRDRAALRGKVVRAMLQTRRADGTWPSYWWRSSVYATEANVRLLHELGEPVTVPLSALAGEVASARDLAYLILLAALDPGTRCCVPALTEELVALQASDGRWHGSPDLRVTNPSSPAGEAEPEGRYFVDHAGLVTTAAALRALCSAR